MIDLTKPTDDSPCLVIPIRWCLGSRVWHLSSRGIEHSTVTGIRVTHLRADWLPRTTYTLEEGERGYREEELHPTLCSLSEWLARRAKK